MSIQCTLIEFDQTKDAANREKHGISLGDAALLDWDTAVVWEDARFDYGEERMCVLGYIGLRLHQAVFVDRQWMTGDAASQGHTVRRIISLRKANKREYRDYAKA